MSKSSSSNDGNNNEEGNGGKDKEMTEAKEEEDDLDPTLISQALSPVNVPDKFPNIPVLAIGRNPLFPRFVKMLEVRVQQ